MNGFGAAILSGILLYLSSPGAIGEGWLAWFALTPLLLALATATPGRAALLGLICGLVYHLPLLRWITIVLGEHGGVHPLVAAIALFLLSLYMALYPALFAWLAATARPRIPILWSAPVLWVGLDCFRAWFLTGFPWQDLGYSQYRLPLLLQVADLAGHHGITFLLVLSNGLLAALILAQWRHYQSRASRQPPPAAIAPGSLSLLTAALLPLLALAYGAARLPAVEAQQNTAATLTVGIIQGNIPQNDKWAPAYQRATVDRYLELSNNALAAAPRPELLIWPETALPFYPLEHHLFSPVAAFARRHRLALLTGAPHRQPMPQKMGSDPIFLFYNSALLVGPEGRVEGLYHKQHLVPFGEYIPFRRLLPFFAPIVETLGDFTPGPGPELLAIKTGMGAGTLICFEAIFPELARRMTTAGADLLINITNDAWFGRSHAPYQHLSMAVLRAVENRRSLARAANTGISAFVLPSGQISEATGIFTPAQRSAPLPLLRETTFFSRFGHWFAPFCLLLVIVGGAIHLYGIVAGRKIEQNDTSQGAAL